MSRRLVASFVLLAGFAIAAGAGANEYRFFDLGDRVYHQRYGRVIEPISEPHIHLARAERAFVHGNRAYAADNLEKAAAGFEYFSERAAGSDRRQLELVGQALDKLARDVRRNEIDGIATLERALSDARSVLAGDAVMTAPAAAPAPTQQS